MGAVARSADPLDDDPWDGGEGLPLLRVDGQLLASVEIGFHDGPRRILMVVEYFLRHLGILQHAPIVFILHIRRVVDGDVHSSSRAMAEGCSTGVPVREGPTCAVRSYCLRHMLGTIRDGVCHG